MCISIQIANQASSFFTCRSIPTSDAQITTRVVILCLTNTHIPLTSLTIWQPAPARCLQLQHQVHSVTPHCLYPPSRQPTLTLLGYDHLATSRLKSFGINSWKDQQWPDLVDIYFSHFHEISYPIAIRSIKINRTIVNTGHILNCYVMYEYATHIEGLVEP